MQLESQSGSAHIWMLDRVVPEEAQRPLQSAESVGEGIVEVPTRMC